MNDAPQGDRALGAGPFTPGQPPDQTVDGVGPFGLIERHSTRSSLEGVAPVTQAVGPRRQYLAPPPRGQLLGAESIQNLDAVRSVSPKGGAHLGDHSLLAAVGDLELFARRRWETSWNGHDG